MIDCYDCDNCIYVGEGGYWCDRYNEIVIDDFIPSNSFMICNK